MMNQIAAGIRPPPEEIYEKPPELMLYEQCREMNIPLVEGGYMDQPYMWLLIFEAVKQEKKLMESLAAGAINGAQGKTV